MKKHNLILVFALMAGLNQLVYANETAIPLSKSCLKEHPVAVGFNDQELLQLYHQLCDKSNKKNEALKLDLSFNIAKRYQILGENFKSLQLIDKLKAQKINTPELTDLTFLVGTAIAQEAVDHMRTAELRALSTHTYEPAKQLSETIRFAQPTHEKMISQKSQDKTKIEKVKQSTKSKSSASRPNTSNTLVKSKKTSSKMVSAVKKDLLQTKQTTSGFSPFATLNKN